MQQYYSSGGGRSMLHVVIVNNTVLPLAQCRTPSALLVSNFTVSPDLKTPEKLMVTTTVLMTVLGTALFAVGILGRFSGRHRGHSAATRIFFRASFALFLPFMSYMFSQAHSNRQTPRAQLILLWMLLVELLRKKVYAMVAPAPDTFARGVGRYSLFDAVEEAARMVWIGYLIYSYVHGFGVKSFFIILWIFSIAKLCKRAICIHLAKDSFDLAKNATLVSGYMAQLVGAQRQLRQPVDDGDGGRGDSVMKTCNYVVMGESQLKKKETPHGIEIDDDDIEDILDGVESSTNTSSRASARPKHLVRVSTIWGLAESDKMFQDDERRRQKMKNICLGLALFKLLRRRMERCHMAETNTPQARAIVLQGLLALGGDADADAERAFEVVEMELRFLEEYYQAIIPLALPKPRIFIANFAFSIAFILLYCITVLLVTGNGNIFRVLGNLFQGLAGLSIDMVVQFQCFRHQVSFLFNMVCSSCDLIVTFLLTLTLLAVETYEFAQYLLSDWFAASILCNYARKPHLQEHRHARRAVKTALWVRHRSHPVIKVHQVTMLKLHQLHPRRLWVLVSRMLKRRLVGLHPAVVTTEAKVAIVTALRAILSSGGDYPFSHCMDVLRRHGFDTPNGVCDGSGGAATVILVWHLATELLERTGKPLSPKGKAVVTLSRYCAYLVSYEPGLLPDDKEWTEKTYRDMSAELDGFFRSCCTTTRRRDSLLQFYFNRAGKEESSPMARGVKLGGELKERAASSATASESVWTMLLEFWAELLVFVASRPSAGPDGHAVALANGGEFITHIWAMITHAGVRVHKHHDYQSIPVNHVMV